MDIMDKLQKATEVVTPIREKQRTVNVSEVFYVWDILVTKLDIMETVQIFDDLIDDIDLKFISDQVRNGLQSGIITMEKIMNDYGLPFPIRPPADKKITNSLEHITDRDIFQSLFEAIQAFFPILSSGFMNSTSPTVRKAIKNHLLLTMELHETVVEYGKLKGFLNLPPVYQA